MAEVDMDELMAQLKSEFSDYMSDRLSTIYNALDLLKKGQAHAADTLREVRREIHSLKGSGTTFGYPIVSLIAQRLETYVNDLKDLDEKQIADLQTFADRMAEMAELDEQPDIASTNLIIRRLPTRYEFDITDVEIQDVEIMLVTPNKLVARRAATELAACGYRVNIIPDPIEAISIAVRMPPDMIIASAVMDGLGGIDLIRGLRAMSVTAHVPAALMTSMGADQLRGVPEEAAIIRLGATFSDDIAATITRFNLG
ncbi:Hpt domain-containing protein [Niveispirillum fermenti]|uniref:Hpt domain-containing protein n=1 Tax=Niveispirillum fermenti TaxID=1233113 RepID=UPI003A899666